MEGWLVRRRLESLTLVRRRFVGRRARFEGTPLAVSRSNHEHERYAPSGSTRRRPPRGVVCPRRGGARRRARPGLLCAPRGRVFRAGSPAPPPPQPQPPAWESPRSAVATPQPPPPSPQPPPPKGAHV